MIRQKASESNVVGHHRLTILGHLEVTPASACLAKRNDELGLNVNTS